MYKNILETSNKTGHSKPNFLFFVNSETEYILIFWLCFYRQTTLPNRLHRMQTNALEIFRNRLTILCSSAICSSYMYFFKRNDPM